MPAEKPTNDEIANLLDRIAGLLEAQEANVFRVRAYREGAETVRKADQPVTDLVERGKLDELPNIGQGLTAVIGEYVETGRSDLLDELRGEVDPQDIFAQVPGIGKELAQRIVDRLGIDSLEELEQAAHDGRLQQVSGFGPERIRSVQVGLAGLLSGAARRRYRRKGGAIPEEEGRPSVDLLLDVDAEYRRKAEAGELKRIAPKRFNPSGEAWLPVLNTGRGDWSFTALFSNTARAHELRKTQDWVVIYYKQQGPEEQATVVTETSGPLAGKRVVRGREKETQRYYEEKGR